MSFYKKYELDRLMADGEAKTFRAVENATGRSVFLHLFNPSGQALLATLKSRLGGADGKPVAPLIEIGDFAGSPFAVTEAIEPFGNLRDWIATHVTASNPLLKGDSSPTVAGVLDVALPTPPAYMDAGPLVFDQAAPASLLSDGPGEFTRFFGPGEPAPPVSPASTAPSEFTRLFEGQPGGSAPPRPAPASAEPGEFTRMFEPLADSRASDRSPDREGAGFPDVSREFPMPSASPAPGRPPLWPPPSPRNSSLESSQFSGLFGSRLPGEDIDIEKEHAQAARSEPPENRPFQAAGEFTRMFGPPGGPGKVSPPPSPGAGSTLTSASGMFADAASLARLAAEALSAQKPAQSAPGEYTRVFDAPRKPEEPPKLAAPVTPIPEAVLAKKSNRGQVILIAVGAGLLVVLIVVVAVLLLKR